MSALRDSMPPGVGDVPRTHVAWATFSDRALEAQFQKEDFALSVQRYVRFSVPVSVVAFLAYGVHDALVIPEARAAAWLIRYGMFGPVAALLVAFVLKNRRPERHQPAMLVFGLSVNLVVFAIGGVSPPHGFFLYTSYACVFVTLGTFIARMSVKTQVVYTAATVLAYLAFDMTLAHAAPTIRLSFVVALVTLGSVGALAARQIELQARLAFIQRRVIREQMAALDVERSKSESLLLNVLPRRVAERLKEGSGTIADGFASATVLFCDIVGFTELSSRLEPADLVRGLDTVFSRFDEIADELELEKIKTIGDAYMVAGGVPTRQNDHAVRVCEMALRMRECIAGLELAAGSGVSVRIGIHTGAVVAGVIGKKKFIYDVWGDTVNTASRMESHGVPGAVHVSEATYEASKDRFSFEPRGEIAVKGKGTMRTFFLLGRAERPP